MNRLSKVLLLLFLVLSSAIAVQAQGRATVFGTVTDSTGAIIPNAQITLTNIDTSQVQATISSTLGRIDIYTFQLS